MHTLRRRVVTGHNEAGKSAVLFDGPPTNVVGRLAELWCTDETPAIEAKTDTAVRKIRMEPAVHGSIFRCVEVRPEAEIAQLDEEARQKLRMQFLSELGGKDGAVDTSRHPGMHRTRSIDYVMLLKGRLTLLLDEGEVELEPMDVVVQQGTNHAWINKGAEPAVLLAVMVGAEPR